MGEIIEVDSSYISRLERGIYPPPSREITLKLINALGIEDKIDRLVFLLSANVAGLEDMQGFALTPIDPIEQPTQK